MAKPHCLYCDKPLRRYRYRKASFSKPGQEYGGYGDNHFCGLNCGHDWAVLYLSKKPELAAALHASMDNQRHRTKATTGGK